MMVIIWKEGIIILQIQIWQLNFCAVCSLMAKTKILFHCYKCTFRFHLPFVFITFLTLTKWKKMMLITNEGFSVLQIYLENFKILMTFTLNVTGVGPYFWRVFIKEEWFFACKLARNLKGLKEIPSWTNIIQGLLAFLYVKLGVFS